MDKCKTCGQTEAWHKEHHPRHPFVSIDGESGDLNGKKEEVSVTKGLSADPALRIALVNAGVIDYAQVMAAEEELRNAARGGKAVVIDSDSANGSGVSVIPSGSGPDVQQGDGGSS